MEHTVSEEGRKALVAFVKALAEGETACEHARHHLCEAPDFSPHKAFRTLGGDPSRGYISIRSIYDWLSDHQLRLPQVLQEDVAELLLPLCYTGGELRYEGFLKIILPRDDDMLSKNVLHRNVAGTYMQYQELPETAPLSAETCYRMSHVFEEEIDLARQIQFHRKVLRQAGVSPHKAFKYLSSANSVEPNPTVLTQLELQHLFMNRLNELTAPQSHAFVRRVGISSPDSLTCSDLVHLLKPWATMPMSPHLLTCPRRIVDDLRRTPSRGPEPESFSAEDDSWRPPSVKKDCITPRSMSPRVGGLLSESIAPPEPEVYAVLSVIRHQWQLDHRIEQMKELVPSTIPVEAIFGLLDSEKKGSITATDLWHFVQECHCPLQFSGIFALIREVQNRRRHDPNRGATQLSLRELAVLLRRQGVPEHHILEGCTNDEEARGALCVLQCTEACPGCSARIQRESDSTDCPNVVCPLCGKAFQCFTVVDVVKKHTNNCELPHLALQSVCQVLKATADAAEEMEGLRKELVLGYTNRIIDDTFYALSEGRNFMTYVDLRRALYRWRQEPSDPELRLLWHRYAPGNLQITLTTFAQQLQPTFGRV